MNIILVSGSSPRPGRSRWAAAARRRCRRRSGSTSDFVAALNYLMLRVAADLNIPYLNIAIRSAAGAREDQSYLRENLNAMACGSARCRRSCCASTRWASGSPSSPASGRRSSCSAQTPGQGGAASSIPSQDLSLGDLTRQLELLTRQVDDRGDKLGVLESLLTLDSARKKLIPTMLPVQRGWHSSNYGWRIDPFNGQRAFHEGIDFIAEHGNGDTRGGRRRRRLLGLPPAVW